MSRLACDRCGTDHIEPVRFADGDAPRLLQEGKALQGFVMGWRHLRAWAATIVGAVPHEVWYTERNGDPIVMLLPAGTPPERFPPHAMDYIAFEWIHPEDDFGGPRSVHPRNGP